MREVEADWDKQTYIDWVNKGRRREGKEKRGVVNKQVQTHHDVTHWFGDYLFWSLEIGFKGVAILVFWSQKLCSWRTGRNWAGARGGSYWEPDMHAPGSLTALGFLAPWPVLAFSCWRPFWCQIEKYFHPSRWWLLKLIHHLIPVKYIFF